MKTNLSDAAAHTYYLPYQIAASVLWALAFMLIGLFLAWVIWGSCKARVAKIKAKNAALKAQADNPSA